MILFSYKEIPIPHLGTPVSSLDMEIKKIMDFMLSLVVLLPEAFMENLFSNASTHFQIP